MDQHANLAQKVETREDEEQSEKFFETIELLLAAGYFRARIKGLSPFDKVVGGMTWCILTCEFDVDVNLLFQENSTIGQKIALTEKIVAVLPRMKCPHRIEPHQIQGLDFIHIFPVIQWLVKRAIETREVLGDKIRAYSVFQFNKKFELPQDKDFAALQHKSIDTINTFKESYKPKRIYKKPSSLRETDEETQVQSTLLEYGQKYGASKLKNENESAAKQKALAAGLIKVGNDDKQSDDRDEAKIQSLMQEMSEADIQQMLSSRTVGSIIGLQSEEISNIVQEYTERKKLLEQETNEMKSSNVKLGGALQSHKRQVNAIQKSISEQKLKIEQTEQELADVSISYNSSKETYEQHQEFAEKLKVENEKLAEQENHDSKGILSKLRSLVALNESLKEQEKEFKLQCKVELKELESKISAIEEVDSQENNAEIERMAIISEQYDKENEKFRKIKLLMAKKSREISSLQWKIDDVPSRSELSQYQRRFVELYNQVAATHKETKQFYTLYNTLDDTKLYLEKECGYLNSIHDGFEQASSQSESSKEEFLQQLEKIVHGVKLNKEKVEKKKNLEKSKKDALNAQMMELVEKQRLYYKTVRDFQEECKKSEIIYSKLRAAGITV